MCMLRRKGMKRQHAEGYGMSVIGMVDVLLPHVAPLISTPNRKGAKIKTYRDRFVSRF